MTTWVLLRGLTRDARHWGEFPGVLWRAFPGNRIVTPDLPGFGERRDIPSPWRVEGILDSVREDLRTRGVTPPYRVLALSLGAMVASEWMHRHPRELAACVLVSASLGEFSPAHRRLAIRNYPSLFRLLLPGVTSRRKETLIHALTSNRRQEADRIVTTWTGLREKQPVSRINALRQLVAAARYRGSRQAPGVPLLVVAGGEDRLVDPDCSRSLARAWDVPFRLHPSAGHDVPLDEGEWVADEVRKAFGPA